MKTKSKEKKIDLFDRIVRGISLITLLYSLNVSVNVGLAFEEIRGLVKQNYFSDKTAIEEKIKVINSFRELYGDKISSDLDFLESTTDSLEKEKEFLESRFVSNTDQVNKYMTRALIPWYGYGGKIK